MYHPLLGQWVSRNAGPGSTYTQCFSGHGIDASTSLARYRDTNVFDQERARWQNEGYKPGDLDLTKGITSMDYHRPSVVHLCTDLMKRQQDLGATSVTFTQQSSEGQIVLNDMLIRAMDHPKLYDSFHERGLRFDAILRTLTGTIMHEVSDYAILMKTFIMFSLLH